MTTTAAAAVRVLIIDQVTGGIIESHDVAWDGNAKRAAKPSLSQWMEEGDRLVNGVSFHHKGSVCAPVMIACYDGEFSDVYAVIVS